MANAINIARIKTRLTEMFAGQIDMSDFPDNDANHFETRAIAALALMMKCDIDIPTSVLHITDGYHDMGIDALYVDDNQMKIYAVQSKWRKDGQGSISQTEMQTFVEGIDRILNFDLNGSNPKIMAKKNEVEVALEKIGYSIQAVYIHSGDSATNDYAKRPIMDLMNRTNDDVSTLLDYEEIKYDDIYAFLAQGQGQDTIDIDDVILSNWGKVDVPYTAYYGLVSAAAIGTWYRDFGNKLFAKNIRYYKGDTDVNAGICKVLIEEPENFVYYNNGIKILCNSIRRKARESTTTTTGLFSLQGVSVVNGAQTTGSIGSAFLSNPDQVGNAKVMIEIIDLSTASPEIATKITKLSNTQNRIENKDFASTDPVQERLRQDLSFSHYQYLYKSGAVLTNETSQITFDEAIVSLACCSDEISYVVMAKNNVGALSADITKPPYKILMNSSTNAYVLLNSVLTVREIERYLSEKRENLNGKERLVAIHANRFMTYRVLHLFKREDAFNNSVFTSDQIRTKIIPYIDADISAITAHVSNLYIDSYPANIFKNVTKCKALLAALEAGAQN